MRKLGVFTALALSGMTASCAERMVNPAVIPKPAPAPKAAPEPRPNNLEARRQAERIAEDDRGRSAIRPRQVIPSASVKPEPPKPQAPQPQAPQQPRETSVSPDPPAAAALPPLPEPAGPNSPVTALMPEPPEPAEPTFPSVLPNVELPPPPEPALPTLPEVPVEAATPPPPEPAEPSFPIAALPPPSEPTEPSLPSQEEVVAESSVPLPFPDLPSYLSLRPRFDWVDTVGAVEIPQSPLSEALEASPEKRVPSLIRNPWPLAVDGT
jgi:hypothetical protein